MEIENLTTVERLEQLRITATADIPPHEFLFKWNDTPCFARGELVAVTGKAKSGKTYLNSILMAACAGEGVLGLNRISERPLKVVWIDTEQSEDTTCEILRDRIGTMIGSMPDEDLFHVFNLRRISWQERMTMVLAAIATRTPDIVIFDGIRDVVGDINNYEEAQNIIGQLLAAASMFHSCIVCVLHQNKAVEDKTLRGALGSELQNKSYETYECVKKAETQIFTIKQTATRKYDMPNEVAFCLSPQGLPTLCTVIDNESEDAPKEYDLRDMFRQSLMGHSEMRAGALKAQVKMRYGITSDTTYGGLLVEALNQGIVLRRAVSNREVYYQPGPNLYEQTLDFGG